MEPSKKGNCLTPKEDNFYIMYIWYFLKNDIGFIILLDKNFGMMKKIIFKIYFRLGILMIYTCNYFGLIGFRNLLFIFKN